MNDIRTQLRLSSALAAGTVCIWLAATPALAQTSAGAPSARAASEPQGPGQVGAGATPGQDGCTGADGKAVPCAPGGQSGEPAPLGSNEATTSPSSSGGADVVVTGTRIRLPNAQSVVPISSISGDQFYDQGRNSVGDTLNDLPQLRSTIAQQNPGSGVGIAGLNLLDLRGLGTQRTLVLVNGRRHVASDIQDYAVSVDTNTIPNNLIDRVDIVTGGNSAVYGSDAIAGVVNFVLKHDFDGLELRANAGIAEAGFGGNQLVSALAGKNFDGGKGNLTLSAEYAHQDRVFASDIPWYRTQDGFGTVDIDPAGLPNGSDGFPDAIFLRDIRSTTLNRFGLVPVNQSSGVAGCGTGITSTNGASSTVGGVPYSCTYVFGADGRVSPQTGTRYGSGPNSGILGGNGQTGREDQLTSVYPFQNRYNFNLLGHYTFSPAVEAFVEAKWVRVDALGNNAGPSFTQGTRSQFDGREQIRLDNPFLDPADRTTLANAILAGGCNTSFTTACSPLTAANRAAIADGSYRFVIGKQFADAGIRDQAFRRTTWRVVGGLRGSFLSDFSYELSGNYGKFTESQTTFGYLDKQRFLLSLDAGRNPVTGQIQCRSQFDPTAATAFPNTVYNQNRLAADIAACVPYNPFGSPGNAAATKYAVYTAVDHARIEQLDLTGFVSGSTASFFNLPGGPVRFALGGEYRSEKSVYAQDPFAGDPANYTTSLSGLSFAPPAFKVKEAYGELQLPVLKDLPFVQALNVSGAARVSSYRGSTGTVWAYNYGGDYSPVRDIRFRVNYGRAVRAPNVSETGGALVPNFANSFADPCRSASIGTGTQYRAANCAADLGALLNSTDFANQTTYSLPVLSGANPKLQAETSDSLTVGGVIQPRYVPGLTLSVDYYNIRVKNVIQSLSAQTIANSCYDQASLSNPFCALFTRYRGPGTGGSGEVPGQILANSLIQAPVNYAKQVRKGIDTQISYRAGLGGNVGMSANLIYSHNIQNSDFVNPQDPNFEDRILSELGTPKDEFTLDADLRVGAVTFGYRLHYIAAMYNGAYENYNSLGGRPAQNLDAYDIIKYPAVAYHSIRLQWDVKNPVALAKSFQFFGGVDNLFDRHPPLGSLGTGSGSAIYDIRGRNFYAGVRAGF